MKAIDNPAPKTVLITVRHVAGTDAETLLATRAKLDDAGYLQLVSQSFGLEAQAAT